MAQSPDEVVPKKDPPSCQAFCRRQKGPSSTLKPILFGFEFQDTVSFMLRCLYPDLPTVGRVTDEASSAVFPRGREGRMNEDQDADPGGVHSTPLQTRPMM